MSEARLWSALSASQLGVSFRRQVPLARRFIVDFYAPRVRLVVEVDGGCHAQKRRADARRDAELQSRTGSAGVPRSVALRCGYRVLRIDAALVMRDLPAATALVRAAL